MHKAPLDSSLISQMQGGSPPGNRVSMQSSTMWDIVRISPQLQRGSEDCFQRTMLAAQRPCPVHCALSKSAWTMLANVQTIYSELCACYKLLRHVVCAGALGLVKPNPKVVPLKWIVNTQLAMGDSVEMVAVDVARLYQCSNRYFR